MNDAIINAIFFTCMYRQNLSKSRFCSRQPRRSQWWPKNLYRDMCVFVSSLCITLYSYFFHLHRICPAAEYGRHKGALIQVQVRCSFIPTANVVEVQHGHFTAAHLNFKCFNILPSYVTSPPLIFYCYPLYLCGLIFYRLFTQFFYRYLCGLIFLPFIHSVFYRYLLYTCVDGGLPPVVW